MNTKESIQKTFIKLYSKMEYDRITIKELCIQTPVARTTFYSYYSNIDELKSDIEMSFLNGLRDLVLHFQEKEPEFIDLHEFLRCSMVYIENNWETVSAFLVTQPDPCFIDKWKSYIKEHFQKHYSQKQYNDNFKLISEMIASSAIDCYRYWMQNKAEVNDEKLFQMVQTMINSIVPAL